MRKYSCFVLFFFVLISLVYEWVWIYNLNERLCWDSYILIYDDGKEVVCGKRRENGLWFGNICCINQL